MNNFYKIFKTIREDAFGKDLKEATIEDKLFHKCWFDECMSFLEKVNNSTTDRGLCTSTKEGSEKLADGQCCIVFKDTKRNGFYDNKDTDAGKYFGYDEFRTIDKITHNYIEYLIFPDDIYKFYDIYLNEFYIPLDMFDYEMAEDDFESLIYDNNDESLNIKEKDILFIYEMIHFFYDELNLDVDDIKLIFDNFDEYDGEFGNIKVISVKESPYTYTFLNIQKSN